MVKHVSVRFAWHDDKWDGGICRNPKQNVYCTGNYSLLSSRLQRRINLDLENQNKNKQLSKVLVEDRKAKSILEKQFEGYQHLVRTFENKDNVLVLARLGIFHSSITKPMFKFVYPNDKKRVMFNPKDWAPQILEIFQDQKRIWDGTFKRKMVVEKIKTPADGSPAMGKRYRRVIEHLKSKDLLIEDRGKTPLFKSFRDKYYYKRGNEIYESAQRFMLM